MGWILGLLGQCSQLLCCEGESPAAVVIDVGPDIVDGCKLGNPHGQLGVPAAAVVPEHVQHRADDLVLIHSPERCFCP